MKNRSYICIFNATTKWTQKTARKKLLGKKNHKVLEKHYQGIRNLSGEKIGWNPQIKPEKI